ncbi:hypothetical protein, partial [Eubacterium sp.]|uniref:hypothetical protein n=1 Tax=Eubacterium sp. TaxID=142586 RepID=UPI003EFE8643
MEVKFKSKIKDSIGKEGLKQVGIYGGYFFAGLISALGGAIYDIKPFGIAFVAVSKKKGYIFSAIGAILGYLVFGFSVNSIRYLCAALIAGLGAFLIELLDLYHIPSYCVAVAVFANLITGEFV